MNKINDDQRWVYPHWHPYFPQDPHPRFTPYPGRPMGDESYRHATVLSFLGRGPKGAKGDTFTYDDMTPADKADIVQYLAGATGSVEDFSFSSMEAVSSHTIEGMDIDSSVDIVFVYVNGILTTDFTIEGDTITFTNGVSASSLGNDFLIRVLRFEATSPSEDNTDVVLNFLGMNREALTRDLGE